MTQEDKELLLRDLSARLPYGVMVDRLGTPHKVLAIEPSQLNCIMIDRGEFMPAFYSIEDVKLYLRPMSSMTEDEKEEYEKLCILIPTQFDSDLQKYDYYTTDSMESFDWLLKNHFDVRDLIEKGLAIAVTEDNNPYK